MKTCKTCIHWQFNPKFKDWDQICEPIDQDSFEPMIFPFEVRECMNPSLHKFERTTEIDGFCITDASEYLARLCTAPNFGCVKHTTYSM